MPSPLTMVIEGWHHVPHSYAMCTQHIELELLRRSDVKLFHTHRPYVTDFWKPDHRLFSQEDNERLGSIPARPLNLKPDAVIRMDWPFRFESDPSECTTFVWGTTEAKCVPDYAVAFGRPPREELQRTNPRIIALSRWAAEGFLKSGANEDRVHVVPAGYNPEIFFRPATESQRTQLRESLGWTNECVLLNISAISPNKGIHLLLRAAAVLIDRGCNLRIALKGTDSLYQSESMLQRIIDELPHDFAACLQNRIQYCGDNLTHDQLRTLYQAADFYVAPYVAEGFNMPVLEAAACGLPVICTSGGSTEDFIDDTWCRTIQSRFIEDSDGCGLEPNIESLISILSHSITDTHWIQNARTAGPVWAREHYTWQHVVDQLLAIVKRFA
jgi:glycosyltransferase involved in cell wall biosynthesis